ncbi:MAG: hypothetical protein QG656_2045, partial [Candidatus Hydrogenedentes bacterium]|nr:hypothetical protein [Candidatus Hydrogenedentota bacterium]
VARGLSHVDFASDEMAVQLDFKAPRTLEMRIAVVKAMPKMRVNARVVSSGGKVWTLPSKQFDADTEKVIRATYEWEPPDAGAYEFMAELVQNGKVYALGRDTASPHGGIDTQFSTGTPGNAEMAAWTDAPYALERRGRTLDRAMACGGGTAIWFEPSTEKVFRDDVPTPTGKIDPKVRIGLARNERESFQLVLRPPKGTNLTNVKLRVGDLTNRDTKARIAQSNIAVSNVAYYDVRVPTNFEGPTGAWPDALPPFKPMTAEGGQCTPIWFTVYAAPDLPAGLYSGMIELSASELEPVELWIEARVYNFALPVRPALKTDFGFSAESALEQAKAQGYKGDVNALCVRYIDNALAHRVTLRELAAFPAESARYEADLDAFAPRMKAMLDRGATTLFVPPSLLDVPDQLRQANAFVTTNKLQDRVFTQLADEPPSPAWPRVFERMQQWKDAAPDIPIMVTTVGLEVFLPEPLDIWGVHEQILDTVNNQAVLERIGQGGEVWWYVNHCPPRPYGNFFIDFAAIEHRILFWQAWVVGIRGFHHWSIDSVEPGQNPWTNQLDVTPANGNGFLVYAGPDGPVDSIRWEAIRDGIEDYDYLTLLAERIQALKKKGGQEALIKRAEDAANLKELVSSLVVFSRDPAVLTVRRTRIADAIEQLGKALGL